MSKGNSQSKDSFDAFTKVAVIGDSSVGKTNILLRFVNSDYQISHIVTIGIDFKIKLLHLDGFRLKMQIWDTAGQQRFRNLTGTIYQGAQAIILVYSIANRKSFEDIEVWIQDLANHSKNNILLAIVGNKSDLESERKVKTEEGEQIAEKYNAVVFKQTSAKNGVNIDELFEDLGRKIKEKLEKEDKKRKKSTETGQRINLQPQNESKKKGCDC